MRHLRFPSSPGARVDAARRVALGLALPTLVTALLSTGRASLRADTIREDTYTLAAGWNLVHLHGAPLEPDPDVALASVDWESIWTYVPPFDANDPSARGRWVSRRSAGDGGPAFLSSLKTLSGPASYALLLGSPGELTLRTAWRPRRAAIGGGCFELFGPSLPEGAPPTLAEYFSRAGVRESISGVFELRGGSLRAVGDSDALRDGAAYWVFASQDLPAPDPVQVTAGLGGLAFDSTSNVHEVEVDLGADTTARTVSLRARASADGQSTTDWIEVRAADDGDFVPLGVGATIPVAPNATRARVVLRARLGRGDRIGAGAGLAPNLADQAAVLQLDTPRGRVEVGVELEVPGLPGIWFGDATLDEVQRSNLHGGGFASSPPLRFSVLLEVPESGRPRLLPCVVAESDRDGRAITYRLEAALFHEPNDLFGTLASNGTSGTLTATVSLAADHPLNPYRHRYHPEHTLGYDVTRSIRLRFEEPESEGEGKGDAPFAAVGGIGGTWEEEIAGLADEPVRVRGSFRLRRLSTSDATPCTGDTR